VNPVTTGAGAGTAGTETGGVQGGGGVTDGTEAWAAVPSCVDCLEEDGGRGRGGVSVQLVV
jgi:hypothetical protein